MLHYYYYYYFSQRDKNDKQYKWKLISEPDDTEITAI